MAIVVKGTKKGENITVDANDYAIYGEAGDDNIIAGKGADTIYGGKGNDILTGGDGADTFVFYKGDGVDTILDATAEDTIQFADRKNFNGLSFEMEDDDLKISDKYNTVTIEDYDANKFVFKNKEYNLVWDKSNVFDDANGDGALEGAGRMYNVITGTGAKDKIKGVSGIANYINAGDGNDVITGVNAGDMLAGNGGADKISASKVKGGVEIYGGTGNDTLTGSAHADWIAGNEDDDKIYGGKGNDTLLGGSHELSAEGSGNDTIYGGKGNDLMAGGDGADTFVFYKGDGVDTILDAKAEDTIQFADRKNFNGLAFDKDGSNLVIADDKGNSIIVKNYTDVDFMLKNKEYNLVWEKSNVFDDANGDGALEGAGRMYNVVEGTNAKDKITAVSGIANYINAGAGNDVITGVNAGDMLAGNEGADKISASKAKGGVEIYGGTGNDTLTGSAHADWIAGNEDDDKIYGGKGNDTLLGGSHDLSQKSGNDLLVGGKGHDLLAGGDGINTYEFNKGDGNDTYMYANGTDTLKFNGIKSSALTYSQNGNDLVINYAKDSSVTVKDYYVGSNSADWDLSIQTKNGKVLLKDACEGIGNDTYSISADWENREDLPETILTETFVGGLGNDTFNVGKGTFDVTMTGGAGADTFNIFDTWNFDTYWTDLGYVAKGADITITDFGKDDTIILRKGNGENMFAEGQKQHDGEYGYSKFTMFYDVKADGTADLSQVMMAMEDKTTVEDGYNAETGRINTSFVIKTEDNGSILDAGKVIIRDSEGNEIAYKFNEEYFNAVTAEVAAWLTANEFASVADAIDAGRTDVLTAFVDASLPFNGDAGISGQPGGYDILVPIA